MNPRKFLPVAEAVAGLSKDPSTKVGAVILDRRGCVRAVGYNGFPRGISDDLDRLHNRAQKLLLIAHAEVNAITNAAAVGTALDGCTIVVTKAPCSDCAKAIINAGIVCVVSPKIEPGAWGDSQKVAEQMFSEAGVLSVTA